MHVLDLHGPPRHVEGAEQLPGRLLVQKDLILHQGVRLVVGSAGEFQRVEGEESASRSHGFHVRGLSAGLDRKVPDPAEAVLPESGILSLRREFDRILRQRRVDLVLQLPDVVLLEGVLGGQKGADLGALRLAPPPGGLQLVAEAVFLDDPEAVEAGCQKEPEDTDLQTCLFPGGDSPPSLLSPHCCTSSARRTCMPAATGLVVVVMTYS